MKTIAKAGMIAVAAYAVSWTATYTVLMEGDFKYFIEYLGLAWTGPGEMPAMLQFLSLAATGVTVALFLLIRVVMLRKRQQTERGKRAAST